MKILAGLRQGGKRRVSKFKVAVIAGLLAAACLPQATSLQCVGDQVACNGVCVTTSADPANCGMCGNSCNGLLCSAGQCSATCAPGLSQCGTACADLQSNPAYCGSCTTPCGAGVACVAGVCQGSQPGTGGAGVGVGGSSGLGGGAVVGGGGPVAGGGPAVGGGGPSGGTETGTGGTNPEDITGYFTSGSWHGFAFTATYTDTATTADDPNMITPANFEGQTDWPLCVSGTVAAPSADKEYNGAMVGWSLNQERMPDAPLGTIVPSLEGITVSVTAKNNSQAQLRLQIQGPNGATDASDRWCTEIGTGGTNIFVPWSTFNTECWAGGDGTPYNGTSPLSQVIVQVPNDPDAALPFDFCLDSVAETNQDGMSGTGCDVSQAASGNTGTLAGSGDKYARRAATTSSPQIYVQNNIFGSGGQYDISYNGAGFTITNFSGSAATSGAPMGYPSLFIGSAGGNGMATGGSNLAKQVSALTRIPTGLRWSGSCTQCNVAYDVWFAPTSGDNGSGSRSFLMVWFHKTAEVFAEGEGQGESGGTVTIANQSWKTYVSQQFEGRPIISYLPSNGSVSSLSFDLNDFIKDAKNRTSTTQTTPVINNNLYLTNVFAGFEVWSGANNLKADKFCIQVE
jgi:hypothetical protein